MQSREGGGGRRLLLSSGVDRLMLNGISANLEHLRRQSKPSSQPLTNGDLGQAKPEAVQNGVGSKGPNKRLDYNRQAMREIGASIKSFHIESNPSQVTSGTNGCSSSSSQPDNFGRQDTARSGMMWSSNKNTDKVAELVESLSNQETKCSSSQLFVPGYPNKVIRKPSFEEKYRTTSPATSLNLSNNSSSPNYPMSNGHVQQYGDSSASNHPNSVAKFKAIRGIYVDGAIDVDGLGISAGQGYFLPGRGPTFSGPGQLNGHVVPDPGPAQHRFTPRGRSPVFRPALRLVPSAGGLGSRNGSPGTVASSSSGSSPLSVLPPSVRQTTHAFIHNPSLVQAQSCLVSDYVSRTPDEVSPLSSHSPSPASTPSSGYSQNVTDCQVGQGFTQPSQSTIMNTRQNFSKHLCNSKEVERPVPQKATVPPNPRVKASSSELEKRLGLEFLVATKPNVYPVPRERTADPSVSINGPFLIAQDQQNFTLAESHRVAPAPVFYKQPFSHQKQIDVVPSYRIQNDGFAVISNAQSQISLSTTFTVPPTNADIPERPPPPYPGREVDISFSIRPCSAPNEMARTLTQFNQDPCDDGLYCGALGGYQNADADYAPSEQYTDSTDGSSQTDTDGVVVEKQLIESPKPVRKADACRKDAERSETQVRHYPPQAYRFYMEQHMENIFKFRKERLERQMQLEKEMSQVNLPPETQAEIRKMLVQKESNYLRQRRAKIDKSMFQRLKTLGTGAFGEVDLVIKKDTNKLYALKTLQKKDVLKRNQVAHVKAERDILAEADNEWVVKLYYSFQDSANLYIVMDYIPGGDMMGLLIKFGIFEEELAQFYIAELVLAIESVHAMGFIHRDIKPDNILIDKDGHIKLTDFGLCTGFRWTHNSKYYQNGNHPRQDSMDPDENWSTKTSYDKEVKEILKPMERRKLKHQRCLAHSLVGTPNYIAPEVLCKSGYTACCDWWSVGVILYEMRVGQPPFLAHNPADTQMKVINWPTTLSIPAEANLSPETSNLILRLCCGPEERLGKNGSSEVKSHPFFTGVNFETLRQHEAPYIPPLRHPTDTSNFDPVDPDKLRRSASRDSLLKEETYDGGKHAFFEFTFRRFFDDEGIAQATRMHDPESDTAIFV